MGSLTGVREDNSGTDLLVLEQGHVSCPSLPAFVGLAVPWRDSDHNCITP